jgi:uncharacterized protein with GYD domain
MAKEFKDVLNSSDSFNAYSEKVRQYTAENGGDRKTAAKKAISEMGVHLTDEEMASINGGSGELRTLTLEELNTAKASGKLNSAKGFNLEYVFICSTH